MFSQVSSWQGRMDSIYDDLQPKHSVITSGVCTISSNICNVRVQWLDFSLLVTHYITNSG